MGTYQSPKPQTFPLSSVKKFWMVPVDRAFVNLWVTSNVNVPAGETWADADDGLGVPYVRFLGRADRAGDRVLAGTEPAAVFHANRVMATSPAARAQDIVRHHRRREAQARCPSLLVLERVRSHEGIGR